MPWPDGTRKRHTRLPRPRVTVPRSPLRSCKTKGSARPGGCGTPAMGGAGAGRVLWGHGRARTIRRRVAGASAFAIGRVGLEAPSRLIRADQGNALCLPNPRVTVPRTSVRPVTTKGQRPARRARGAGHRRGGRWPCACEAHGRSRTHPAGGWQRRQPLPW